MKGGRLRIINESSYPTDEVERLVRYGLDEIDVTGRTLTAIVKPTKRSRRGPVAYSGNAYSLEWGVPTTLYDRYMKGRADFHLIVMRIGQPEAFPIEPFKRNGELTDYRTWQEALVGITAHEGMHIQHAQDGSYRTRSGTRKPATFTSDTGRVIPFRRGGKVRVGDERIEPKCEAFEAYMLRRFRNEVLQGMWLVTSVGVTAALNRYDAESA